MRTIMADEEGYRGGVCVGQMVKRAYSRYTAAGPTVRRYYGKSPAVKTKVLCVESGRSNEDGKERETKLNLQTLR